jgi:chromosome condensin MukBEF ATPase and DNA-binding subunit MukB
MPEQTKQIAVDKEQYACPVCDSLSFTQDDFDRDFDHCICRVCRVHFSYDDCFAGLQDLGRKFLREEWQKSSKDRTWQAAARKHAFSFLAQEYTALQAALAASKSREKLLREGLEHYAGLSVAADTLAEVKEMEGGNG